MNEIGFAVGACLILFVGVVFLLGIDDGEDDWEAIERDMDEAERNQ